MIESSTSYTFDSGESGPPSLTTSSLQAKNLSDPGIFRSPYDGFGSAAGVIRFFPSDNSSDEILACQRCDAIVNVTNGSGSDSNFISDSIPYEFSIVLIALYTFTTLAAVLGNSLAIVVFAKGKRSNTDLRSFLINLAVADLIMAIVCIPFTFAYQITENWIFPDVMCPIVQCCQQVSVLASVCTNTAIGIDRLIAVKFPLRKRVTSSRSKLVILCIWVLAWSLGIVPLVKSWTVVKNGKLMCEEDWSSEQSRLAFGFSIMIMTYFLPVTILSVTYAMIGRQLWKHKVPGNADDHRDAVQLKCKRKVVKMLVTIVLLFGVCWLPLHIFIIIITFNFNFFGAAANTIYFGVHWLSMANSFVNPLIYGFMNESFRADLNSMVHSCLRRRWGHRKLKHRTAALRWKLGDCNVHDASNHVQSRGGYMTKSLHRHELKGNRQNWRNGHTRSTPSLDVAGLCTCELSSVTNFNSSDCSDLNHQASQYQDRDKCVHPAGKRRAFTARERVPLGSNLDDGGGTPGGNQRGTDHVSRNARLKCRCDPPGGVLFDGSDVVLLQEHQRKELV